MRRLAILVFVAASAAVACGGGAAASGRWRRHGRCHRRRRHAVARAVRGRHDGRGRRGGTTGGGTTGRPARAAAPSSCLGTKPTAANTGVPAGFVLTLVNGDMTVTQDGTTIDGKDIHGFLIIDASHVHVTRSIVRGRATPYAERRRHPHRFGHATS